MQISVNVILDKGEDFLYAPDAAAMQVLVRAVPGLGAFCYGPEGPVVPPGAWSGSAAAANSRPGWNCGREPSRSDWNISWRS